MVVHEPTVLHEIVPAPCGTPVPGRRSRVPHRQAVEQFLYQRTLQPWGVKAAADRIQEVERVAKHVEISLNALIDRQQVQLGDLLNRQVEGQTVQGLDGLISQAEQHLDELNNRLERRRRELELERHCAVADIKHLGRAWVLPHPERNNPQIAPMVRDDRDRTDRRGGRDRPRAGAGLGGRERRIREPRLRSDLPPPASRRPQDVHRGPVHRGQGPGRRGRGRAEQERVRYGRPSGQGLLALRRVQLCRDAELHTVQDPARLGWKPMVTVEHYQLNAQAILQADKGQKD